MIDNMLVYFSFYISLFFVDTSNLTFKDSHKRYLYYILSVFSLFFFRCFSLIYARTSRSIHALFK